MAGLLRKLFSRDVDKKVDAIYQEEISPSLHKAGKTADSLNRLLKKNGVTLQIYIATGGDNHDH